jgi:hypothetical protein
MLLLAVIFFAGILHGLGPDHLAAITAYGAIGGHGFRRLSFFSLRFAGGHAMVLLAAALLAHFGRMALPAAWERGFDVTGGSLLVLTGTALLAGLLSGKLAIHRHDHIHAHGHHEHLHAHFSARSQHQHAHGRLAFALGGLFALGGARSLLVLIPAAMAATLADSMLRVGAFALGIVIAMCAYGLLAGQALTRATESGVGHRHTATLRWMTAAVALFCVVAGCLTLAERWHA